jgi:RHS repeat-associated protein
MRKTKAIAVVATSALALSRGAVANNNWSSSYRGGTISLPSADESASNRGTGIAVNQGLVGYSFPIDAPPGFRGLTPELALQYSSSRSEGAYGAQWTLAGVPTLAVRTSGRGGQPVYGAGVTYLGFSGEELVPTAPVGDIDGDGVDDTAYREERDRLFARYVERSTGGWLVEYPDGRKLTLGTTADARIARAEAAVANEIWMWLPEVLEDRQGNQLTYRWEDVAGVLAAPLGRSDTARYLVEVRYGCQSCATASAYQKVTFTYAPRTSAGAANVLDLRPAFLVEWEGYLSRIDTYSHTAALGDRAVRRYTPTYTVDNGRMLLASVATRGDDGTTLPTVAFTYTDADAPASPTSTVTSIPLANGLPMTFSGDVFPADMDLDGRIDLVKCQASSIGTYRWWRNIGTDTLAFDPAGSIYAAPPPVCPDPTTQVSPSDVNRDLGIDMEDFSAIGSGVSISTFVDAATGWAPAVNAIVATAGTGDDLFRVDANRDGYIDLLTTTGAPWVIDFDDSTYDYTLDRVTCDGAGGRGITPAFGIGTLSGSDAGVVMAELTGDDLSDTLFVDIPTPTAPSAQVLVWPGRGRGCFGFVAEDGFGATPYFTATITAFADGISRILPDPGTLQAADVDGDGYDDLIWLDSVGGRVGVWTYDRTAGFVPAYLGAQTITSSAGCRVGDFGGDGASDIFCSHDWKLYRFAGGATGHLETATNGRGVTTTISYTTSARMAADAEAAGHRWGTNVGASLRFANQVVVDDGRAGREVMTYVARDAYYKRDTILDVFEIVGFAYVEETRIPELYTGTAWLPDARDPGRAKRTWYDVGATTWTTRGAVACEETWTPGTMPTTYTCGATVGALSRLEVQYVMVEDSYGVSTLRSTRADRYPLEGTASTAFLRDQQVFDDYGNTVSNVSWGGFRANKPRFGEDEMMTVTDWITDTATWLLRSPKRVRQGRPIGSTTTPAVEVASVTFSYYDGALAWNVATLTGGLRTRSARWGCDPTVVPADPRCAGPANDANAVVEETVAYTANGLAASVTDAAGVVTTSTYDPDFGLFLVAKTLDPTGLNLATTFAVDARHGGNTTMTGPDGRITRAGFDSLGRMTALAKPGDSLASPTVSRRYVDGAPVSRVIDSSKDGTADRLTGTVVVDGLGRLLCSTRETGANAVAVEVQKEWSALGSLAIAAVPYASATDCLPTTVVAGASTATRTVATALDEHTVDGLGRPISLVHSTDGSRRTWTRGVNQVTILDEEDNSGGAHAGTERVELVDGMGRLVRVSEEHQLLDVDPGTHTFDYAYAFDGKLVGVTDSTGSVIFTAAYDARRRLVVTDDATRGATRFAYDDVGRITSSTDARGEVVDHQYDAASRVLSTTDSTGVTSYTYDAHPNPAKTATCNSLGRLGRAIYPAGETTFCYDNRGRTSSETTVIHSLGVKAYVSGYQWDNLDRLVSVQYPDASRANYTYGADGRLETVQAWSTGTATQMVVTNVDYTPWGAPLAVALGNGATLGYAYDGRGRPAASTVDTPAGRVQDLTLALDLVGNVTTITDGEGGFASASYAYDDLYRLVSATGSRYGGETATYEYDRLGNMTRKAFTDATSPLDVGAIVHADPIVRNAVSEAGGKTFTYDAMGNLTADGTSTFTYTPTGSLHEVLDLAGVTQVELEYDHAGRRIAKLAASGASVHYFPGAELRDDGTTATWNKDLVVGGRLVGRFVGKFTTTTVADHVFFVATDHLGSPTLVLDTAGDITERYDHHPHGEESTYAFAAADLAHGNTDYMDAYFAPGDPASLLFRRFQGREIDSEYGKYDFGARIYDPELGRFMTADSVVPDPGSSQSWNRYAFVRNNPLAFIDPTGHADQPAGDSADWVMKNILLVRVGAVPGAYNTPGLEPVKQFAMNYLADKQNPENTNVSVPRAMKITTSGTVSMSAEVDIILQASTTLSTKQIVEGFQFMYSFTDGDGNHVMRSLTLDSGLIATENTATGTVGGGKKFEIPEVGKVGASGSVSGTETRLSSGFDESRTYSSRFLDQVTQWDGTTRWTLNTYRPDLRDPANDHIHPPTTTGSVAAPEWTRGRGCNGNPGSVCHYGKGPAPTTFDTSWAQGVFGW